MPDAGPVVEIRGRFADESVAAEVAEAINRWVAWILAGSETPVPACFEPLGVESADYAWSLEDDVDWSIGPHARALGEEVRLAVETRDTHLHLSGLMRRLGARGVVVRRQ